LQGAKVLTTLKPWAELISIAGAALLFFSWVVSNTLQQRYQAAKASVERAQSERRLYGELAQARQSIDSLAAEILNTRQGLRAVHAKVAPDSDATRLRHEEVVSSIASKKLNARQIDWGLRFCSNEQELAQALDSKDDSIGELNNVCKKMSSLREQKEEVFKQIDQEVTAAKELNDEAARKIRELEGRYSKCLLPQFGPLLEQAVNASNAISSVAVAELKKRKARADVSSWVAFFAYIVGTCLVIFGRVVDKLV
jgi:hypothetical protein